MKKEEITKKFLLDYSREFTNKYFGFNACIDIVIEPYSFIEKLENESGLYINGFFYSGSDNKPPYIGLSGKLFEDYDYEELIGTLKHELVHYSLWTLNKPFHDDDDYFIEECKRCRASLSVK